MMKYLIILLGFYNTLSAQKYEFKHVLIPSALSFISGASYGVNESISHHWSSVERRYPNINQQYWNPEYSWRNKYNNGIVENGPKYLGSTTFLVWTTDAYHLTNSIHRTTLFASGLTIGLGSKKPWWHYCIDVGISFLSFSAGFHAVYTLHFK